MIILCLITINEAMPDAIKTPIIEKSPPGSIYANAFFEKTQPKDKMSNKFLKTIIILNMLLEFHIYIEIQQ